MSARKIKKLTKRLTLPSRAPSLKLWRVIDRIGRSKLKGFTLIELLVVIGILSILLAVTLIAINPARQFQQANDAKRKSDVTAILNAINQYMVDQNGEVPLGIDSNLKQIAAPAGSANADLCFQLVTRYLAAVPVDPSVNGGTAVAPCPASYTTGYYVVSTTDNRITVSAPQAEGGSTIEVTR